MVKLNNKKGQSLPLNTIVIAILVIIVLLVIVVFFTTNVGKSGEQLNKNDASKCSLSNAAIATLGYDQVEVADESLCQERKASGWDVISIVSLEEEGKVCCGLKE